MCWLDILTVDWLDIFTLIIRVGYSVWRLALFIYNEVQRVKLDSNCIVGA